jgi:hypothetical protein
MKKQQTYILTTETVIIVAVIGSIFALGIFNPLSPPSDEQYSFVKAWGESGSGPGE